MAYRTDKNLRAGLYARVSTEDRGQNPETQLRPLREYAERRGFVVVGEFVDHASGTTETRPQYQKLLEVVRKRGLDLVLVWRYDRFARSTRALVNALGEFKAREVAFISYQENVDTTTPQGELVFGMMANLAQFESALIGERVKAGMARAKAQGKRTSRPPIPEVTRKKIAELHSQGISIKRIAKELGIAYGTAWNYVKRVNAIRATSGYRRSLKTGPDVS
jgi:DNA invertase Pin-like site-specific DNA recombinase